MTDGQRRAALRWIFYFFGCFCSYFAVRDWCWYGSRGAIEPVLVVLVFLLVGFVSDFLLLRALVVVWVVLGITGFLSTLILVGYLAMRAPGDILLSLLWLSGCVFGILQTRYLRPGKAVNRS